MLLPDLNFREPGKHSGGAGDAAPDGNLGVWYRVESQMYAELL